jgi:hypothetical protein
MIPSINPDGARVFSRFMSQQPAPQITKGTRSATARNLSQNGTK